MVKRLGTFDLSLYLFLVFVAFTMLYPFWELFALSFMEHQEARRYGFKIWPKKFILDNYLHVLENNVIFLAYRNTVIRTVLGVTVSITLTFMTAYPLAHKTLPLNKPLTMLLTFTMFFSGGLIPTYLLVRSLGMYNNIIALIFVNLLSPFYIFLVRNYIRGVPDSLEESAKIDGATYLTILSRIIVPVCKPIVATLGLWIAVMHWNAWFDAMIYTPTPALVTLAGGAGNHRRRWRLCIHFSHSDSDVDQDGGAEKGLARQRRPGDAHHPRPAYRGVSPIHRRGPGRQRQGRHLVVRLQRHGRRGLRLYFHDRQAGVCRRR